MIWHSKFVWEEERDIGGLRDGGSLCGGNNEKVEWTWGEDIRFGSNSASERQGDCEEWVFWVGVQQWWYYHILEQPFGSWSVDVVPHFLYIQYIWFFLMLHCDFANQNSGLIIGNNAKYLVWQMSLHLVWFILEIVQFLQILWKFDFSYWQFWMFI